MSFGKRKDANTYGVPVRSSAPAPGPGTPAQAPAPSWTPAPAAGGFSPAVPAQQGFYAPAATPAGAQAFTPAGHAPPQAYAPQAYAPQAYAPQAYAPQAYAPQQNAGPAGYGGGYAQPA